MTHRVYARILTFPSFLKPKYVYMYISHHPHTSAKTLLQQVSQASDNDRNDWCSIESPDGTTLFLNKRTGVIQPTPPPNYTPVRQEEFAFDTLILDDGTEVTTYESPDGVVMYVGMLHDVCDVRARSLPFFFPGGVECVNKDGVL